MAEVNRKNLMKLVHYCETHPEDITADFMQQWNNARI
jgi:hypothetical protein